MGGRYIVHHDVNIYIHICTTQPTTSDHINMKYIWSHHGKPYGGDTLITYGDMQKVYTLNKYNFQYLFIIKKPSIKW